MKAYDRLLPEKYAALQMGYWMDYLVIFSFAAVFLMGRGFSATEIGYVTTAGAVLTIVLQMTLSSLADRAKRISLKEILAALMLGCIAAAGVMMLLPKSHHVTFVCMFTALSLTNTLSPLMTSLCLKYNEAGQRINFGVTRSLGSLGYALAAFVMGRVTEAFGAEIILPIYCVIYALMLLLLATMKRPVPVAPAVEARDTADSQPSGLLRFFVRYRRYDMFLLAVMAMFFMQMLLNTYMIYFVNSFGGGEAEMGTALFVSAFAEMPAVALGITLLKRFSAQKLLRVSSLASFVKCAGLLFIPNSACFIGLQALQFFCSGLYMVASVYFISAIVGRADGVKAQAIMAVGLSGITGIAGNIIGGYMLERMPVRSIILLGAVVAAVGVALMFLATGKHLFQDKLEDIKAD